MKTIIMLTAMLSLASCFYTPPAPTNEGLYGTWQALIYPDWSIEFTAAQITYRHNDEVYATAPMPDHILQRELTLPPGFIHDQTLSGHFTHQRTDRLDFVAEIPREDSVLAATYPTDNIVVTFVR